MPADPYQSPAIVSRADATFSSGKGSPFWVCVICFSLAGIAFPFFGCVSLHIAQSINSTTIHYGGLAVLVLSVIGFILAMFTAAAYSTALYSPAGTARHRCCLLVAPLLTAAHSYIFCVVLMVPVLAAFNRFWPAVPYLTPHTQYVRYRDTGALAGALLAFVVSLLLIPKRKPPRTD